MLPIVFKVME